MLVARFLVGLLAALPLAAAEPLPQDATFHSRTRLVEVEVVIRNQPVRPPGAAKSFSYVFDSGPPFGPPGAVIQNLTKDDFRLFDEGKPQPIAVFSPGRMKDAHREDLPPGVVSNRQDSRGRPLTGSTAIVADFYDLSGGVLVPVVRSARLPMPATSTTSGLQPVFRTGPMTAGDGSGSSPIGFRDYARMGLKDVLRSLGPSGDRIALYTLGQQFHTLHDFDDGSQGLSDIANQLEPRAQLSPALAAALNDFGDLWDLQRHAAQPQVIQKTLAFIIQRLAQMPGRKNLVWLGQPLYAKLKPGQNICTLFTLPDDAVKMLQQANVALYPVLVRSSSAVDPFCDQRRARETAAATGGRAFFDALDLTSAVHSAQEESSQAYVLGFYPAEEALDGRTHRLTVKLTDAKLAGKDIDVHYRPTYLATKAPTSAEALESIGLTARLGPDPAQSNLRQLSVTVDSHDIHLEPNNLEPNNLEPNNGRFTGAFDVSVLLPGSREPRSAAAHLDLDQHQLAQALETGFVVTLGGIALQESGDIRVVVTDSSTGAVGSLRIPASRE